MDGMKQRLTTIAGRPVSSPTHDPYTGQQLRCLRTLPRHEAISGPFVGQPQTHRGDLWAAVCAVVVAILIITSEWLGYVAQLLNEAADMLKRDNDEADA